MNKIEDKDLAKKICKEFKNDPSELINIINKIGKTNSTIQETIAKKLEIPIEKVKQVSEISGFFMPKKSHNIVISVCSGSACRKKGVQEVVNYLKENIDKKQYTIKMTNCMGACGLAPIILIDNRMYQKVDLDKIKEILAEINK